MSPGRPSVICDRVRGQISLELDGELSELECAMVAAHLARCPACHAFEADTRAVTDALRSASLQRMHDPVVVRRRRRFAAVQVSAGVAAAIALAAVGVSSQIAASERNGGRLPQRSTEIARFPTQAELEHELALLEIVQSGRLRPTGARETLR